MTGFDPDFLEGHRIEEPVGDAAVNDDIAPTTSDSLVRAYTHFSLAMSASRRFCRWVAWNIDGNALRHLSRVSMRFVPDEAYDAQFQVGNQLYTDPRLDRGHVARRADLLWGPPADAQQANRDSFFFTNITPQLDDFNQSSKRGLWGELENAIFDDVEVDHLKVSVLGGPIFKDTDFPYREILVPRSFWKVIAYAEDGALKAQAFVLTQDDLENKLESLGLEEFKLYQTTLQDLSERIHLDLGELEQADTMGAAVQAAGAPTARRIDRRDEIVLRP